MPYRNFGAYKMDEISLKSHLAMRVSEFGARWNSIESDIYAKHKEEDEALRQTYPGDEYHYVAGTDWFEIFGERIEPLFDHYCTDKRRVYGGKGPRSFGFPSKFNGVENPTETLVEIKTKTRAEVLVKTQTRFQDEYLFVFLKKTGEWKIDSYKSRRYGGEVWDSRIL
ncbi:NTF2 fold immunity protein [Pseudomonas graminis]|uniref:NTF2 fold immunity protein n=1 Tax=Pseudomonas graminis TaxID=158627 RepID=UPI0032656B0D